MHTLRTSLTRGAYAHRSTLTVLLLLLAGWGAWLSGHKAPRPATPILGQPPVELTASIEPPATFSMSDGEHAISVRDPNGAPLAGAELWQSVPRARWLDATHSTRLATTDHTGTLSLPTALPPDSELVLRAPGHRTAALPPVVAGSTVHATLRRATPCRIRCRLADGSAVIGARIAIGRASMPTCDDDRAYGPAGADSRAALHTATTDATGLAVLDGLAPGDYALQITHDAHVIAPASAARIELPADEIEVRLVEVIGRVLTPPPDDEVIGSGTAVEPGSLFSDLRTMAAVRRIQDRLQREYAGHFVSVLPAADDGGSRSVRAKVLLRRGGWKTFSTDLAPLRQLALAPMPSAAEAPIDVTASLAELHVVSQRPLSDLQFALMHDEGGVVCHIPTSINTPLRVPAGNYKLDAESPIARSRLPRAAFTLRANQTTEIPLDLGPWYAVTLRVDTCSGDPIGSCGIEVECQGRRVHQFIANDGRRVHLMLPAGEVTLSAEASGLARQRARYNVPGDLADGAISMRLDYGY